MAQLPKSSQAIKKLLDSGNELPLATKNYPSRGQTAVQKLFQTKIGKLFLKKASLQNHIDCQIDPKTGSIAEREYWAYELAKALLLRVPPLRLIDNHTTIQVWFDMPDAHLYKMSHGIMDFTANNVFDCALFDWLTGQVDRHDANYLYDLVRHKIVLIDSAHGFLKYEGSLPDYLHLFEIGSQAELVKRQRTPTIIAINAMSDGEIQKLVPLRSTDQLEALVRRKNDLKNVYTIQDIINLYRGTNK